MTNNFKGGKKKENSWIKHVKKVAKEKKISYKDALKIAKKTYKKKKVMKGGDSNMGQTGFPGKYFGNDVPMNSSNGFGVKTAYGISEPLDVGMGNLAPFNTAKKGPKLTGLQTGGKRKYRKRRTKKKNLKGGFRKIPTNPLDNSVNTLQDYMRIITNGFNNLNNGIARQYNNLNRLVNEERPLITGGKKKTKKKRKKNVKKKLTGGASDWMSTVRSRGPSNYPNQSRLAFRQFNKTSKYIPNNKLAYAATPILSGILPQNQDPPCPYPPGIL